MNRILILQSLFLVAASLTSVWGQTSEPSLLASKYVKRSNELELYACAIFCETKVNNRKDSNMSSYIETWYLHSHDPNLGVHRHDEIIQTMTNGKGENVGPHSYLLVYFQGKKVTQWNGRQTTSYDVRIDEGEEQFKNLMKHSYFEPLEIPICGYESLERRKGPQLSNRIKQHFSLCRFIEEEERGERVVQMFETRNPDLFVRIVFDEEIGGMPVLFQSTIGRNGKRFQNIITKWKTINGRLYPDYIDMETDYAQVTTSRKLKYYWMLSDLPENLFPDQQNKLMQPTILRDWIVEKGSEQKK